MPESNTRCLNEIGKRISELREAKGVTQGGLARVLGVPRSTVAKYETGLQDFKSKTIVRICDYFEVSADYLLRGVSAQALDVYRKTGLTDAALNSLEDEKNVSDSFFNGESGRIEMLNELLSDKGFFYLIEEFIHFRREWRDIRSGLTVLESQKCGAQCDDYPQIVEKTRTLRERAEFLRWKYLQAEERYMEKLLDRE